jgi:hypothetical protein
MIKDIIANLSTSEQPKVCLPQWSPSRAAGGHFSFHDETRGNLSDGLLQKVKLVCTTNIMLILWIRTTTTCSCLMTHFDVRSTRYMSCWFWESCQISNSALHGKPCRSSPFILLWIGSNARLAAELDTYCSLEQVIHRCHCCWMTRAQHNMVTFIHPRTTTHPSREGMLHGRIN